MASGTSVMLSGVHPVLLGESLSDIRLGAPAKLWFGLMSQALMIGTPYLVFSGSVEEAFR